MSDFLNELEQCIPALRKYAYTLVQQQNDADDLVQDCLERALSKRILWRKGSSMRAWLFTMLHNLYVNQVRSNIRKPKILSDIETLSHTHEPNQTDTLIDDISYCMKQLPDTHQQILFLVVVEGFTYKEVSKIMNIPVGTVMSRLSRSRDTMQKVMNGEKATVLRAVK